MKFWPRIRPYHRRDWHRLWRHRRYGFRWRCPDSVELVPMPYQPPPPPPLPRAGYRATIRATASVPARTNTPRTRATNRRRHGWDAPTHSYLANGRAGGLTPGQQHRSRHTTAQA